MKTNADCHLIESEICVFLNETILIGRFAQENVNDLIELRSFGALRSHEKLSSRLTSGATQIGTW